MLHLDEADHAPGRREARGARSRTADALFVFSSGTTGMPKAVRHTHRVVRRRGRGTGAPRSGCRGRPHADHDAAVAHPRPAQHRRRRSTPARWIRLHRRFDIDAMLRHIETDRITVEMAVAPIALALAAHPGLESLRPVVAALHHVVRDARHAERRRGRHRPNRRAVGDRLRRERAARHRLQPDRRARGWTPSGRPVPGVDVRDRRPGRPASRWPAGEVGEIQVRSDR